MKRFLKIYIPQILLIVFSVVLGLYLSEKINQRQDRQMAQQLVSYLKTEVKQCRETMLEWIPYHEKLKITIDSLIKDEAFIKQFEENPNALFYGADKGLFNGDITSTAWETALLNPAISEISYTQLKDFHKVYNQIDITFRPLEDMTDLVFSADFNAPNKSKQNLQVFSSLLWEMIGREKSLIFYCNEVLEDTSIKQNN